MKTLRALAFAVAGLIGLSAAGLASAKDDGAKWSHRFEPCSYWRYDFDTNSYTCSRTDFAIEVPDARDFDTLERTVAQLQQTIQALELRIQALENRP